MSDWLSFGSISPLLKGEPHSMNLRIKTGPGLNLLSPCFLVLCGWQRTIFCNSIFTVMFWAQVPSHLKESAPLSMYLPFSHPWDLVSRAITCSNYCRFCCSCPAESQGHCDGANSYTFCILPGSEDIKRFSKSWLVLFTLSGSMIRAFPKTAYKGALWFHIFVFMR